METAVTDRRRRQWLRGAAAWALGGATASTFAQQPHADSFPSRPITLWVPRPAGGATDITLRLLAEGAGRQLGVKVLTDNRPGAGGTLAMPVLQQAVPDGYTIAQLPQTVFRAPWTRKLTWDPIRDVTPIIQISGVTFGIAVPAASALKSLDDLFAYAKGHPGELTVATNGVGTTPHVVMEELFA